MKTRKTVSSERTHPLLYQENKPIAKGNQGGPTQEVSKPPILTSEGMGTISNSANQNINYRTQDFSQNFIKNPSQNNLK